MLVVMQDEAVVRICMQYEVSGSGFHRAEHGAIKLAP
jgi:hypothetical protein